MHIQRGIHRHKVLLVGEVSKQLKSLNPKVSANQDIQLSVGSIFFPTDGISMLQSKTLESFKQVR